MAVNRWKLIRAEKQEALLQQLPLDHPALKDLDKVILFQMRFERGFQRALRELQRLRKNCQTAAKERAKAEEAAAASPAKDPHPPIPPAFTTSQKDHRGRPVIDMPGLLWNSVKGDYQMVFDPHWTYHQKLRATFFPDPQDFPKEDPPKDAKAEGNTQPEGE
ncbi:MAG TPA: hypothetical protein VKV17_05035 [Bryobacteraceae bacterium]|nr:hypothetical protein [Bryobacteraceae bacterium]